MSEKKCNFAGVSIYNVLIEMDIFSLYRRLVPYAIRHAVRCSWYFLRCNLLSLEPRWCYSLDAYKNKYPKYIQILSTFSLSLFASKPRYSLDTPKRIDKSCKLKGYVMLVHNAVCFARSGVVRLHNGEYLYDLKNIYRNDLKKNISCCDGTVLLVDDVNYYHIRHYYHRVNLKKGILFTDIFSDNYYHFTLSVLPKLEYLDEIPLDIPLLVDANIQNIKN